MIIFDNISNYQICVDLDNTLIFTDDANNQAYLYAINEFLPNIQFDYDGRITESIILNNLNQFPKYILSSIIELKQKCFSNFINLTYINYHLLEKLNVMKTSSVLYLTSCGKKSRVERVLIHHGLHDLFNDIICNEKKFEIIVNKTQDINKILVFDDDKIQLDMAHVAGIKKENLFLVHKENIYGFEKIYD